MNILQVCKMAPANPPSQFSLPLTFLDISWLPLDPTSRVFFYKFQDPNTDFLNILLPKLKNSLALTLHHYLPVAGNLTWPKDSHEPIVQYKTGDGLSLTISETKSDFYSLSSDGFRESAELRLLLPDFPCSETSTPVMTMQITLFPNTGFSIAYVAHHAVLDGRSVSLFLHSWAYLCRNGDGSVLPSHLTPFLDRSLVEKQSDLKQAYPSRFGKDENFVDRVLTKYETRPSFETVLGTFTLTRENINDLKKSIEEKNNLESGTRLSSFTIASAYAFVCLIKTTEKQAEKAFIGINVDARTRLEPPIPSTYFGNCVFCCGGGRDMKDFLSEDGFFRAVEVVSEALSSLNEGPVKVAGKIEGLIYAAFIKFTGFFVAGSPRFELYKVDFGWGRPIKVEMVSIAKTGAFALSDDRENNGGIEIGIALKKPQSELFSSLFANGLAPC